MTESVRNIYKTILSGQKILPAISLGEIVLWVFNDDEKIIAAFELS